MCGTLPKSKSEAARGYEIVKARNRKTTVEIIDAVFTTDPAPYYARSEGEDGLPSFTHSIEDKKWKVFAAASANVPDKANGNAVYTQQKIKVFYRESTQSG